jgi:hypothetical protein
MVDLIQFGLVGLAVLLVGFVVSCWPFILATFFIEANARADEEAAHMAHLKNLQDIADAGIAARARGETFVPPSRYDRS